MKLITFTVTNFRSITTAHKTPISDITVLIGKNNEGKSNLLKALNIVMTSLRRFSEIDGRKRQYVSYRSNESDYYVWHRDFPITLQNRKSNTESIFRVEFELSDEDVVEFKNEIKSNLNGTLPIEIKIGKSGEPEINVIKKGRGSVTLNSKSKKIAEYIAKRIYFNYIPAIRTDQQAMQVVEDTMSRELSELDGNKDYEQALETIKNLQNPILKKLSDKIKTSLCELLPNIKDVSIEIQENRRRQALRQQFEIHVNDGNKTSLEFKGDGVKSLAAMALLKDLYKEKGRISLVAIEEPESHLHPGAIHILRDTIYSLTDVNQVIISTHNPLFVDRINISSNIIIDSGKVNPAKNIKEIRSIIGVKASDNLQNANYVLIVEGQTDVDMLKSILSFLSDKIKKAILTNSLVIEKIGGAGNLPYKISTIKSSLCVFHVFLDNDDAGRNANTKAISNKDLEIRDTTFTNCIGMNNSEIEDCLKLEVYKDKIESQYGVNLDVREFNNNNKWSDRIKQVFQTQGRQWNGDIEAQVKENVTKCVTQNPKDSLCEHKRTSIDSLVKTIENIIKTQAQ